MALPPEIARVDAPQPYERELTAIAACGSSDATDVARASALARYLVSLHGGSPAGVEADYAASLRAASAAGLGPIEAAARHAIADRAKLEAFEKKLVSWRWRLADRAPRRRPTHGALSAARIAFGSAGTPIVDPGEGAPADPALDVVAVAGEYLVHGLRYDGSWGAGFAPLWQALWSEYLSGSGDFELLDVAPPFVAWHALAAATARPLDDDRSRRTAFALFTLADQTLSSGSFDPDRAASFVG